MRGESAIVVDRLTKAVSDVSGNYSNSKLAKAVTVGSAVVSLAHAGKSVWDFYKKATAPKEFYIKIRESDGVFNIVEKWLMDAMPESKQRAVYARTIVRSRNGRGRGNEIPLEYADDPSISSYVELDYKLDGEVMQEVTINGHQVKIFIDSPESSTLSTMSGNNLQTRSLVIICPDVEARNAVLEELRKQAQVIAKNQPSIFVSTKWGGFNRRKSVSARPKETVILKEGQMERILDSLNTFISNREAYNKVGIPFRTGILLHGDPGSGKSSTAAAIANEMNMDVYIISLSSISDDDALGECFSMVPENSILILEDIDVAHAVRDRDDDESGVTMSGMLNVLDGFQSPEGVITIMTTNRLDVLDPAIIRPGRVDVMEELGNLDTHQLRGLVKYYLGYVPENLPEITPEDKISSAEIVGVVRKHMPDFENAAEDLVSFIENKDSRPVHTPEYPSHVEATGAKPAPLADWEKELLAGLQRPIL